MKKLVEPNPKRERTRTGAKGRSLFERLRADDLEETRTKGDQLSDRIHSIKANLVRILNGHVGTSQSAPLFGLMDVNDAAMQPEDLLTVLSSDVRRAITNYEPRVSDVRVIFDRDRNKGDALHFRVTGRTRIGHASESMTIDLVLKGGRRFAAV